MPELLLEILSEEIPARMQKRAASDLKNLIESHLRKAELGFESVDTYVTPRRLAAVIDGIPLRQEGGRQEQRGPRVDAPEQAIAGFKGSLQEGAVIEERETKKGTFLFAVYERPGEDSKNVLTRVLYNVVQNFEWPKSMRWSTTQYRFVRPIRSILSVFDGNELPFVFGFGRYGEDYSVLEQEWIDRCCAGEEVEYPGQDYVRAGNRTSGHRLAERASFEVKDFADYARELRNDMVILDAEERSQIIQTAAENLAASAGLTLKDDPGLLNEVAGLVEWPVVRMGTIDDQFMDVPPEVLITSMKSHQKYFSCLDADGNLANRFIVVANTETKDGGAEVVAGNERVLRARLSDAKFFWDQDQAKRLEDRVGSLENRVFHADLGNLFEKTERIEYLAVEISGKVKDADAERVSTAAMLAKADLSTGMVGEFPELQGTMGRYYAIHDDEPIEVADAIAEHYSPLGPNDGCPSKPESICVALADKIDSLVGFFGINEKPTGSKDPYALRRAALGVIRLILENDLRLNLTPIFETAVGQYESQMMADLEVQVDQADRGEIAVDDVMRKHIELDSDVLLAFFADRLKVHLKEQGVKHDRIDAVFALGGEDDLVRLLARVEALGDFLGTDDGENLLTAYRRAANILKIEEKKDGRAYDGDADTGLFDQDEERALHQGLGDAAPAIAAAVADEDFAGAMKAVAGLRGPVDAFFDEVTVNADDAAKRENRLKLLNQIRTALGGVADFSRIEG